MGVAALALIQRGNGTKTLTNMQGKSTVYSRSTRVTCGELTSGALARMMTRITRRSAPLQCEAQMLTWITRGMAGSHG